MPNGSIITKRLNGKDFIFMGYEKWLLKTQQGRYIWCREKIIETFRDANANFTMRYTSKDKTINKLGREEAYEILRKLDRIEAYSLLYIAKIFPQFK